MRKWELITDLFSFKMGDSFPEYRNQVGQKCIIFTIGGNDLYILPEAWPKHFRLVEEPEFTESDMIEAMQMAWNLSPGQDTLPIIETIRKRKAGKS